MGNAKQSSVQSVVRALSLLEILGGLGGEAPLSELAEEAALALPTVHRLLKTLTSLGYVRQLPSRRYALGPALVALGDQATRLIASWARPALRTLEEATRETANLAILDGDRVVYVAQVPSRQQMRMFTEVGRRVFAHSTGVGKVLLAQLSDEDAIGILHRTGMPRFTPTTLTTEAAMIRELGAIRARGYASDDGEQEVGVRCFAVPVLGASTPTAVSVSGPEGRLPMTAAEWVVPTLRRAADELRAALTSAGGAVKLR